MKSWILFALALLIVSCKNKTDRTNSSTEDNGKKVYNKYCVACHQPNGEGIPGLYPPVSKTDWVNGNKDRLIGILLNGMTDPVEINGVNYDNIMAPHDYLSNEDIADVLTYIRSNFGNNSSAVTAAEVLKNR